MKAASPIAGAVFRPTGSAMICCFSSRGIWRAISRCRVFVRDDPKTARRSERQQARNRLLDHGLLAVEREQLLGPALAAQRPKTRAPPAGENYRIEI